MLAPHGEEVAGALVDTLICVPHVRVRLQRAGVDPEVAQLADVGVGSRFEGLDGERAVGVRLELNLFAILSPSDRSGRWVWEVFGDRVEDTGNADRLRRRAGEYGVEAAGGDAQRQTFSDFLRREVAFFKERLEQLLIVLRYGLTKLAAEVLDLIGHIRRRV